jgi:acid phosphatase class B
MTQYIDVNLQKDAIVFSELGKQYFKDTKKDYLEDQEGFHNFIRTKVNNDSIPIKEAAFQLIRSKTADSLATSINAALQENTTKYLKTSKLDTNIELKRAALDEPENIGSANKFKIKYDMLDDQSIKKDTLSNSN